MDETNGCRLVYSLDSPVVAMYQLDGGDNIQPVPFTSVRYLQFVYIKTHCTAYNAAYYHR